MRTRLKHKIQFRLTQAFIAGSLTLLVACGSQGVDLNSDPKLSETDSRSQKTALNDSFKIMSETARWVSPFANYPNQGGFIGFQDTNSAFPGEYHTARDFSAPVGTPIVSIYDGIIVQNNASVGGYGGEGLRGGAIIVEYQTADGITFRALDGHLQNLTSKGVGERVAAGERLGEVGHYWVTRNGQRVDWPHLHFAIVTGSPQNVWAGYLSLTAIRTEGWQDPVPFLNNHSPRANGVLKANALNQLLSKLNIPAEQSQFNGSLFGQTIAVPADVNNNTAFRNAIVTAYNRGIATSSSFKPADAINRAEMVTMICRALPLGNYPDLNRTLPYSDVPAGEWYRSFVERAYSAGILPDYGTRFEAGRAVSQEELNVLLDKAYQFLLGPSSGINIYMSWIQHKVDLDLYMVPEDVSIQHDANYIVSNLSEIRNNPNTVYWKRISSSWGGNLDFDSWGGNSQPQHASSQERITVDGRKVKRPAKYNVLVHYYDWGNAQSPSTAEFQWWGFNQGQNINTNGGKPFVERIDKNQAKFIGWLTTSK